MGVRGLTTFIAQNSDRYLKRHELHDTYLIIDGYNLAAQLYKWHAKCYDCFGGDYDKYAETVLHFFNLLSECNVIPLLVYDGGYEDKKLKTIYSRVKNKIKQTKQLNSATESSMTVFPLFLRELFVEITIKLNLKTVRCLVEADYEMACIARKLNVPLLSYDSDFYIFDVEYIPFNTVILKSVKTSKTNYKYLDCQLYRVDNFLKVYSGMKKECIPLLGVLLGNDYVPIKIFNNFYKQLKKSKNKAGSSDQQRRIKSLIAWMQNETFESAVRKVLGRIRQIHRQTVAQQILCATNNYICSESDLLEYFNLDDSIITNTSSTIDINMDNICDVETDNSDLSEDSENEDIESSDSDVNILIEDEGKKCDSLKSPLLSKYFEERYKRCLYPGCFIDIILHNRHIFIPIIENYSEAPCHNISLSILSAIYQILNSSNSKYLKYVLRNDRGQMKSYELTTSLKTLPTLNELEQIKHSQSLKYMFDVLELNEEFSNIINEFPSSWRLYLVSIAYWIQNASPRVNECYVCALLVSAIVLKNVDTSCTNETKFLKKFQKVILNIQSNPVLVNRNTDMTPSRILDTVTHTDGIMFMKEIISNFQMITKLQRNPKLFDHNVIHIFAQFQSCAFYIKYLNSLLNNPFEDYIISDFYSGTLIYNLSNNFLSRPQLDTYLQLLMKNSPNIYNVFVVIKNYLISHTPNSCKKNIASKRKRKKKKKVSEDGSDDNVLLSEDETNMYDVNNRFSILKIIDR